MSKSNEELYIKYKKMQAEGKTRKQSAVLLGVSERKLKRVVHRMNSAKKDSESGLDGDIGVNTAVVSSKRIHTLKGLLEFYGLDNDEWAITKVVANKWEVGRKDKVVNLQWDAGVSTGFVEDTGKIFTEPLLQIKAWLVRKNPIEIHPVIKPIVIKPINRKKREEKPNPDVFLDIVLFDAHIGFSRNLRTGELNPFHDRVALDIALQIAELLEPDRIIWGGDQYDLPDWSDRFIRSPELNNVMQPAVYEFSWWLNQFAGTCETQHVEEGNHEARIKRALFTHMSHVFDLRPMDGVTVKEHPSMSIPGLNGFEELGIEWIGNYPEGKFWIHDNLVVEHGKVAASNPGATAPKVLKNRTYDTLFGHIHRHETATELVQTRGGESLTVTASTPGLLGKIDQSIPGKASTHLWNQGFFVVTHDGKNTTHNIEHVPIRNGIGYFRGQPIVGVDHSEEIESVEGVGFF